MGSTQNPQDRGGTAWGLSEPAESGFVVFLKGQDPPVAASICKAIEASVGKGEGLQFEPLPVTGEERWSIRLTMPSVTCPIIIWCEEAAELEPTGDEALDSQLAACPWVLRSQLILAPREAISEYFMVVSLMATIAPSAPALLDIVTTEFITRTVMDAEFIAKDSLPNESFLYAKVLYDDDEAPGKLTMIATQGLTRCGLPELEVIGVPEDQQHAAAVVLDVTVGLALEAGLPNPDGDFEIGTGLTLCVRPAAKAASALADGEVGSLKWRHKLETEGQFDNSQPHACLCESGELGGPSYGWPQRVAGTMLEGDASVFVSDTARNRLGVRARRAFPAFATAFASLARADHPGWHDLARKGFLVQVGDSPDDAETVQQRRQSWWRVDHLDGDGVDAVLVARSGTDSQAPLAHRRIARADLMDWRVELPVEGAPFGPWEPEALLAAVDKVRSTPIGNPREQ